MNDYSRKLDVKSVYGGDVSRALIFASEYEAGSHIIRSALASAEPGKGGKEHYHPDTSEIYLLIDGQAVVEIDGHSIVLNPMGCIQIPKNTKHRIRAVGDKPIKYLALHVAELTFNGAVVHREVKE
ncbi:cupin domain-containing protein [Pragia fontium]|uniref:Cupin domain-containing protein n=1 Tax=Pragia fontium DSM 5563 = ATCC 49100 TaxID=1122977 RepID=A0AAJ5BG62_9GAMM|nr:cupin domain-containing protein [Pragia fontium]SFC19158.1 Cupin domain-containing protein [Pragia fontium DSM 5563 = ATCC 49100]VEJ53260.1 Oxalate decarboxylase oxdC [Pragia fontium]